ncbi:MAG: sigma-70 family RNA polymerase sigma factor [Proteobacteria bacterium]|nr:sigma-70 family RNA polymerase sigma factor [Pseudomonadota bacterium]
MTRYVGGESEAFDDLFRRHAERLHGYFRRTTGSQELANDLTQQTFLQVHRARRDYRPSAPFRPWLYAIAANLRRDHFRARGRRPEVLQDEVTAGSVSPSTSTASDRLVRRCVGSLPEGQREVVVMHWFSELSMSEIAGSLGLSLSAVKVRAHRAYKDLKLCLGGEC